MSLLRFYCNDFNYLLDMFLEYSIIVLRRQYYMDDNILDMLNIEDKLSRGRNARKQYASGLRIKAVMELGGKCEGGCGEERPKYLRIVLLTRKIKGMDQLAGYNWLIRHPDRAEHAKLFCRQCSFDWKYRKSAGVKANGEPELNEKTGEVHYIGGEKVITKRGYDDIPDHLRVDS